MTSLITQALWGIQDILERNADPRVKGWFLMSSPLPTLAICLSYVYIVKVAGPKFMENRKPFELRKVLIAYNAFQVVFSAWLFYESLMSGWLFDYSFRCQPVDYSNDARAVRYGMGGWFVGYKVTCQPVDYSLGDSAVRIGMSGWLTGRYNFQCQPVDYSSDPIATRMVHACWWYYFSKFTEFFDTIFFVLRKKTQHVSTLHVIHHGCMPMSVWFGVKFTPGGHSTFFGLLNTFVHIVMYFYYMVAALGPQYQKFIWWKKYLTSLQMIQFVLIMAHAFQLLFVDCNYPRAFVWWIGMHAVMFFFLFSDFYNNTYKFNRKSTSTSVKYTCFPHMEKLNGHTPNGLTNGHTNGHCKSNGHSNGISNGHTNGVVTNGHAASSYYINGDLPELRQRSGASEAAAVVAASN